MQIGKTFYTPHRAKWRAWLSKNFQKEREIWLVYPKKSSGKPRIVYNDAVEEALCFGWIDSLVKRLDDERSVQRFSPRKSNSAYSQTNIERLKWLNQHALLHPTVKGNVLHLLQTDFDFPDDIIQAIKSNSQAWAHFQNYSSAYQRIRIAYIESARPRPEKFEKRLAHFIRKTEANKQYGYGGIQKYF